MEEIGRGLIDRLPKMPGIRRGGMDVNLSQYSAPTGLAGHYLIV